MKELSIEEKAKAYDKAIAHAKILLKTIGNATLGNLVLKNEFENMFPELNENEDERIRIWIRKELESKYVVDNIVNNVMADKALAWLEKKGEQKSADKIELKFKIGDWVVHDMSDGRVSPPTQIVAMTNNSYVFDTEECFYFSDAEETFRKWTIQDAKDGDVLACGNDIVIFKENNYNPKDQSGCMFVYCAFNKCGYWYEIGGINPTYYKPATKEQRDQLEKAMADTGYEWDAEKKELKKIEQKPAWSDDFEEEMDRYIEENFYGSADNGFFSNRTKRELEVEDVVRIGCHFAAWQKEQSNKELSDKSQQEWSEEDEKMYQRVLSFAESEWGSDYDLVIWLKSFKPQNTWKPSDEQINALAKNVEYVNVGCTQHILKELLEDLKKLKE